MTRLRTRIAVALAAGIVLFAGITPAHATRLAFPAEGSVSFAGRTVRAVDFDAAPGVDLTEMRRFLEIRPGDPWSARQVRRTVEVLSKLGEFDEVRAYATPDGADGVRLTLRITPRPRVRRIVVKGTRANASRVLSAVGIRQGEYYPGDGALESMAEDVARALEAAGWTHAAVEVRHVAVPDSRDVVLEIEVEQGVRQRVGRIEVTGDHAFDVDELIRESGLKIGEPLTRSRLETARRRLLSFHRKLGYLEVKVPTVIGQGDTDTGHATVTLFVQSGERLRVVFDNKGIHPGDRSRDPLWWWEFRDERLQDALELGGESNITEGLAEEAAERLVSFYQRRGYLEAAVEAELDTQRAKRLKTLRLRVDPGRRYRIRRITFRGNDESREETSSKALREAFLAQTRTLSERRYVLEDVELATNQLVNYYRSEGFAEVEIRPEDPMIDRSRRTIDLEFEVEEGPRSRVGAIAFTGNQQVPQEKLRELVREPGVGLTEGDPLNLVFLEAADIALEDYYASIGFPYARVDYTAVAGTGGLVNVGFQVDESIQAYVGRVIVRGNEFTRRTVIDRALPLATGDTYTPELLKETEDALMRLGTFNRVVAKPFAEDQPERVRDVVIGVAEANRYVLEPSIGASTDDGPRIGVRAVHRNLFGSAKSISLRAQANWRWDGFLGETRGVNEVGPAVDYGKIEERVILTYNQPTTFGQPIPSQATTSLFERERRRNFGYEGNRATLASSRDLDLAWGPLKGADVTLVGRYQMFLRNIQYDGDGKRRAVALESADFPLSPARSMFYWPFRWKVASVSLGTLVDRRDDRINPTRGFAASLHGEVSSKALGSDFDFLKATASLTNFRRLPGHFTLATALRGGWAVPFRGTTGLPVDQRFHVGGTGSVRGFQDGSIGPRFTDAGTTSTGGDVFALYNLELRHPLRGGLDWVVFHDAGWSQVRHTANVGDLFFGDASGRRELVNPDFPATAVGLGIRARTPVGPVKFDVGIDTSKILEIDRLKDLSSFEIHFTIGDF